MSPLRFLALLPLAAAAAAGDARATFVNQQVSTRAIALNQPVRVEFTTNARQIETVDPAAAVANALAIDTAHWRVLQKPVVKAEEKIKTLRITFSLLPRDPGEHALPVLPLPWLAGDKVAEFGTVKVEPTILVGGEARPLPKEVAGVRGFAWGAALAQARAGLRPDQIETGPERTVLRPDPALALVFTGGELSEAQINAGGLSLDQARESFLERWGAPQTEEPGRLTWILGWTRIEAVPADGALRLSLVREDVRSRSDRGKVASQIFAPLDGPDTAAPAPAATGATPAAPAETAEQAAARRRKEAEEAFEKLRQVQQRDKLNK